MDQIAIRPARAADEAAIRCCADEAYAPYIPAIGRKPAPMDADYPRLIAAGAVHVAVTPAGEVCGFAACFPRGDHMFLDSVAVRTALIGRGIGKRLIGQCEDTARRLGLSAVRLYTNEKMTGNLGLYPHLGYVETGRRIQDGFHRVFFEKTLG